MRTSSKLDWVIAIISFTVFTLTFFTCFWKTHEIFSSLMAAILTMLLVLGALIVMSWLARVFMK
jgi:hypothetical protein